MFSASAGIVCPLYNEAESKIRQDQGGGWVCSAYDPHAEEWSSCPVTNLQSMIAFLLTVTMIST